jgi:hypothetical protein
MWATASIDNGRKGFATRGKAEEGRISYEDGIAKALATFKEAQSSADPQTMILAEYTFITQELTMKLLAYFDKNITEALKYDPESVQKII